MFKLGKITFSCPLILAPMSGISDLPFRIINRKFGCEFAFSEMINARSLAKLNVKTFKMLASNAEDRPLGIQLVGSDDFYIHKALENLNAVKFDLLDFNAACPKKKVVSKGAGAYLLKEPKKLNRLLKLIVKTRPDIAVTVKMRLGWENKSLICDLARGAQDAGICAIFIHGRTKAQGYSGKVDYKSIAEVKKAVTIPVIGSGDVFGAGLAKKMLDETGVDAVCIARGALGNPWIFGQTKAFLKKGYMPQHLQVDEVAHVMKEHLKLCIDSYGSLGGVLRFRKFFVWYTRGFSRIKNLREKVMHVKSDKEMFNLIDEFRQTKAQQTSTMARFLLA
ncbi:MAG: tRNA dihydrouridine synthase DusB [Candidatus Omnitrophica bacterium]|nr:tRNA dihydrouridine synthase DusB [Candidatus Omnitrophota bacterium]MBU1925598.1 tRNA dihydrouridine synthase DusB [Candidatus Omnitrophota bacterium]